MNQEITLEDKKLIVEKLGFYYNATWGTICFSSSESPKNGVLIERWNPTDDKWFYEIIGKLNYDILLPLEDKLYDEYKQSRGSGLWGLQWASKHKSEIINESFLELHHCFFVETGL